MAQPFTSEMLMRDIVPADTLYVVDRQLRVVYSNEEWSRFAMDNRGRKLLEEGWNRDLLANMSGKER